MATIRVSAALGPFVGGIHDSDASNAEITRIARHRLELGNVRSAVEVTTSTGN